MAKKKSSFDKAKKEINGFVKDHPTVELTQVVPGENGEKHYIFKPIKIASLKEQGQFRGAPKEFHSKVRRAEQASVLFRDTLYRSDLDLAKPDVVNESPARIYERLRSDYRSKDVFGSNIDVLCDLAVSGFQNDCEDIKIKEFFDNWCEDVDMEQVLEWMFQEFWRSGMVRTYKVIGKYEPQINTLSEMDNPPIPDAPKKVKGESESSYRKMLQQWEFGSALLRDPNESNEEYAAKKKRWSKGYVPIAYTVLNPTELEVIGTPMFDQTRVVLRISDDIKELLKRSEITGKITDVEKQVLDNLPPEIKSAVQKGQDIELDPVYVGAVDNRRMPYEKYAINPMVRALESVEYKESLREADYSTIDGITSEILVITVGNNEFPVTDEEELRFVSELFNTAQKSFAVTWNHTLQVKRVPMENVDQILGAAKFQQAETDISGSMRIPRPLLDGVSIGNTTKEGLDLAVKSLTALINYARRQVSRWIRNEYKQIAEAYGFKRIPAVRWDTFVLKDELAIKTLIMSLVDRRIISYESAQKGLGYDPGYEKKMLTKEMKDVIDGKYGILGSPYQNGGGVQQTQRTPDGTPSEGRPKTKPSSKTPSKPTPDGKIDYQTKTKDKRKVQDELKSAAALLQDVPDMSVEEIEEMQKFLLLLKVRKEQEL